MNMRVRPLELFVHGRQAVMSISTSASRARSVTPMQVRAGKRCSGKKDLKARV